MKREIGYYWVKYNGEWTVGYYEGVADQRANARSWSMVGCDEYLKDSEFEEIGAPIVRA